MTSLIARYRRNRELTKHPSDREILRQRIITKWVDDLTMSLVHDQEKWSHLFEDMKKPLPSSYHILRYPNSEGIWKLPEEINFIELTDYIVKHGHSIERTFHEPNHLLDGCRLRITAYGSLMESYAIDVSICFEPKTGCVVM